MTIRLDAPDVVGTRVRSSRVGWVGQIGTVKEHVDAHTVQVEWDVLVKLGAPFPRTDEDPNDLHLLEERA